MGELSHSETMTVVCASKAESRQLVHLAFTLSESVEQR
jgi:hypothetical protein